MERDDDCNPKGRYGFVCSLDRLGRNYTETGKQWEHITKEIGADIVVLDMPILDTRKTNDLTGTLIADIVLKVLSYVAEKERINTHERQAQGIALAKDRGAYKGRKPIEIDEAAFDAAYKEVLSDGRTNKWAMENWGCVQTHTIRQLRSIGRNTACLLWRVGTRKGKKVGHE